MDHRESGYHHRQSIGPDSAIISSWRQEREFHHLPDSPPLLDLWLKNNRDGGGYQARKLLTKYQVLLTRFVTCQEDIDDCADQPCRNGATCEDRVNEYFCECTSGWSGLTCETKINECDFNPCYNGGRCQTLDTGYQCDCRPGFTGKFFNLKNVSVYYYV